MTALERISPLIPRQKIQWKDWLSHLLWNLHSPNEEFIAQQPLPHSEKLWYESADGQFSSILYFPKQASIQKTPVIILTGPIFHPQITCTQNTPFLQDLRQKGHDIYVLSHRGHHQNNRKRTLDYSFDGIVREDIPAALRIIRIHSKHRRYHWIGQGLGGILCLIWIAQSGWPALQSLSLLNTPVQFQPVKSSILSSALKPLANASIHQLLQLKLACAKHWNLSPQERFWLYQSNTQVKISLLQQLLIWFQKGHICNVDGSVNYLEAFGSPSGSPSSIPINIYSTNSEFYGGHISAYPITNILPAAQWIETNSAINFPLFSDSFPRQLHICD